METVTRRRQPSHPPTYVVVSASYVAGDASRISLSRERRPTLRLHFEGSAA
jgi:hypothetical protein